MAGGPDARRVTWPAARRWTGRVARYRPWLVWAAVAGFGLALCCRRSGDFDGYLAVGNLILTGGNPYRDTPPGLNTWPPLFSVFCVPLALLARIAPLLAQAVWVAINLAALVLVADLLARLVYGRSLRRHRGDGGMSIGDPALLVPLVLTSRYLLSNYDHLQINLLLFALTLAGLHLQAKGRTATGGIAIGLAAALKVMPALFIPYLAYRRRWRPALVAAGAAAALSVSPALVVGWSRFVDYVSAWRAMVARGWSVGKMNQSVFAMLDRLIGHGMIPFDQAGRNGVLPSGQPLVLVVLGAAMIVVVLLGVRTFRGHIRPDGPLALAEWSVVFICAAVFGPVTWKAYLVVLLLPNTLLFSIGRTPGVPARLRRGCAGILLASWAVGGLPAPGVVGNAVAQTLDMSSAMTVSALGLLFGLFWIRSCLDAGPHAWASAERAVASAGASARR
jgi:hypothetical protein